MRQVQDESVWTLVEENFTFIIKKNMKRASLLVLLSIITYVVTHAQDNGMVYSSEEVDVSPEPENGMKAFYQAWSREITYPREARKKGIAGTSFISFIVTESGELVDFKVEKGIGGGCDEAAIEAIKKAKQKWKAAMKGGKPVKFKYVLPFIFKLG
jgi:TonB family protein